MGEANPLGINTYFVPLVSSLEDETSGTKFVILKNQSDFVEYCERHAASRYEEPLEYPVLVYMDIAWDDELILSYLTTGQLKTMLNKLEEK